MPPFAVRSEPRPASDFPAPVPVPFMPLPVALPRPMPVPPPAPLRPDLSPPEGDMASEPVPPLGSPTFGPGWAVMTTPALAPLPPLEGGAGGAPASRCAPRPVPLRPNPESEVPEPPPTEGGGGTRLVASCVPVGAPELPAVLESDGGGGTTCGAPKDCAADEAEERDPSPATDGAGATTLMPSAVPVVLRVSRGLPPAELAPTDGGGATTLEPSDAPALPLALFA